jgi:hypothetical protein
VSDTTDIDIEMERIVLLESEKADVVTVRSITTLSAENVRRNYSQYVVQLSPRRWGMKMKNVLKIAAGEA